MLRFAREREPSPESRSTFLLTLDINCLCRSSTISMNTLDFFFFFYLFRERNSRIDRMENETIKKSLNNCKSLVNSIKRFIFRISKACDRKFKYGLTGVIFSRTNVGQFLRILFFSSRV